MVKELRELLDLADQMEDIVEGLALEEHISDYLEQNIKGIRTLVGRELASEEAALMRNYQSTQAVQCAA